MKEQTVDKATSLAQEQIKIRANKLKIIYRRSQLFDNEDAWLNIEKAFNVTMGSSDGAYGQLIDVYILHEVNKRINKPKNKQTKKTKTRFLRRFIDHKKGHI